MPRPRRSHRVPKMLLALLAVLCALFLLLHTQPVKSRLGRLLEERIARLLDARFEIGELDYRLWRGEVRLEDVRYEPWQETTLARVWVEEVIARWDPLSRVDLRVHRPVVLLREDERTGREEEQGRSVEPRLPAWLGDAVVTEGEIRYQTAEREDLLVLRSLEAELTSSAAAGARATLAIGDGALYWDSREVPIERIAVEARGGGGDLRVGAIEIDTAAGEIEGEGHVRTLSPFVASFQLRFALEPSRAAGILLEDFDGAMEGQLEGRMQLRFLEEGISSEGVVDATELSLRELGPLDGNARFQLGDDLFRLTGGFRLEGSRVELDSLLDLAEDQQRIELELEAPSMNVLLRNTGAPTSPWDSSLRAEISGTLNGWDPGSLAGTGRILLARGELSGILRLDAEPGRIVVETDGLSFPGGAAALRAEIEDLERVEAAYQADLRSVERTLEPFLPRAAGSLAGSLEGELSIEGRAAGTLDSPKSIRNAISLRSTELRVAGRPLSVSARVVHDASSARIESLSLLAEENGGEVMLSGAIPLDRGELRLDGSLESFPLGSFAAAFGAPLTAVASGSFEARGSLDAPRGWAVLDLSSLAWKDVPLPALALGLRSNGEVLAAEGRFAGAGSAFLRAELALADRYPLRANLELGAIPWTALLEALPEDLPSPREVEVQGEATIALPLAQPPEIQATLSVESLGVAIEDQTLEASGFRLRWEPEAVAIEGLTLRAGESEIAIEGVVALGERHPTDLSIEGSLALDLAEAWVPAIEAGGVASLDLHLRGSLQDPRLRGEIVLEGGRLVRGPISIEGLSLRAEAGGSEVAIQSLRGEVLGGSLTARGSVPVPGAGGDETSLVFDASNLDLGALVSERGTEAAVSSVSLSGRLRFPQGGFDVQAGGEIQEVLFATEGAVVSLVAPAEWSFSGDGLEVEQIHLAGEQTDLRVTVQNLGAAAEGAPPGVSTEGVVNLQVVNFLLPRSTFLSGLAEVEVEAAAAGGTWGLDGTARLDEGELILESPALAVTGIQASVNLEGRSVRVTELSARAGGGLISGEGALLLPGGETEQPDLRFGLRAEGVRIEYPEGLRSELSADLLLRDEQRGYELSGEVRIQQAIYEEEISPERELLDSLRRQTLELEGDPGLLGRVELDLAVTTERGVILDNNLGRMRLSASVLLTGTLAAPEVSGTVRAEPGGSLSFLRNTYEIEQARVTLTSYPVEPPVVDLRARTEAGGQEIVLAVAGPTDNLRTTLESPSDPSLSRADAAALLLTGRTLEEVRGEEGQVLGEEAAAYLGGSLADLTESGLADVLPVSTVRLDPSLVGREADPGLRFTLGRAVTEDLFLTYSIGLAGAEEQLWIVDYDLPRRLQLRTVRHEGNEYTGSLSQDVLFDFYQRRRPTILAEEPASEIRELAIGGILPVSPQEAREQLDLSEGDDYDYWEARDDAENLAGRLREEGFLSATVEIVTRPAIVVPGRPVSLLYEVDPGPRIVLEFSGDPIPEELHEWVRERFEGYIPPRAQALRLSQDLRWELMGRGYYGAVVETAVEETQDETIIRFEVGLGARGEAVVVEIEGNQSLSDEQILQVIPEPDSVEFFELVFARPDELSEEIELLFAARGYLRSEVLEIEPRFDPASNRLRVSITVVEGEAFQVGEIVFAGAERLPERRLREAVSLAEGERFQFSTLLQDRRTLGSLYRREGFPEVSVRSRLERREGRVGVIFQIEEGERVRVGEIEIRGAIATDEELIREAVTFDPGEPLRLSALTETQSNLYDLQIFRSVDIRPAGEPGGEVRDVVIEVTELPDLRLGYGLRYSTENQFEVTGDVELPNLLGSARRFGLFLFVSGRNQAYRANLAMPRFLGYELDTSVFLSREWEDAEGFRSRSWNGTFQQGRPLFSDTIRAQWTFNYRRSAVTEDVPSGPFPFDVVADRSVLGFSLIEDVRNSITRPTRGRFWNATFQYAPTFLGSDLNFVKLYAQLFLFRPLNESMVWASSYRMGVAEAFDQVLLPLDRFRAGGPSSVRGFPVNELGPADPVTRTVMGGEGVVVINQELRFPLFWRIGGLGFYDAGNVYLEFSDFNPFDLRHSLGAGLTVDLPVGLVSLVWARVLNPPPDLESSRFHFSFGYAF